MFVTWGEGRNVFTGGQRGGEYQLGVLCARMCAQDPYFAPSTPFLLRALEKWQLGFLFFCLVSLYLLFRICPTCLHTAIFSPIQFLCILLHEERCVPVQTLQLGNKRSQVAGRPVSILACSGEGGCSVTQSCLTLCDPMNCSMARLPCPSPSP